MDLRGFKINKNKTINMEVFKKYNLYNDWKPTDLEAWKLKDVYWE